MSFDLVIRRASPQDLDQLAALAGELVRMHHAQDPERFLLVDDVEGGYRWWFGRELSRQDAIILVAARGSEMLGYAYSTIEERDWNRLLDPHGAIHDVFVAPETRRQQIGRRLMQAMIEELERKNAQRIVLSSMVGNEAAQALFRAHGFRPTMLEMTRG